MYFVEQNQLKNYSYWSMWEPIYIYKSNGSTGIYLDNSIYTSNI